VSKIENHPLPTASTPASPDALRALAEGGLISFSAWKFKRDLNDGNEEVAVAVMVQAVDSPEIFSIKVVPDLECPVDVMNRLALGTDLKPLEDAFLGGLCQMLYNQLVTRALTYQALFLRQRFQGVA
jgi:hypothetical protein